MKNGLLFLLVTIVTAVLIWYGSWAFFYAGPVIGPLCYGIILAYFIFTVIQDSSGRALFCGFATGGVITSYLHGIIPGISISAPLIVVLAWIGVKFLIELSEGFTEGINKLFKIGH